MNHNRKDVFTVTLDAAKGETPELLMIAIAQAIFDLAPPLTDPDDEPALPDLRYSKYHVLFEDEAAKFVHNGREVSMLFPRGRMCVAHVFASRLTPTDAEIVLTMYDRDADQMFERADECLKALIADRSDAEIPVELDMFDLEEIIDDEEPTLRLALPAIA
ncbi:MAG TPA: hypothetical protein VL426_07405 [Candidatus Binatia bacterium]|nr:hypothetical protein [Candidatus Binatia bacterium]